MLIADRKTGTVVDPVLVDRKTGRELSEKEYGIVPGPAANERTRRRLEFAAQPPVFTTEEIRPASRMRPRPKSGNPSCLVPRFSAAAISSEALLRDGKVVPAKARAKWNRKDALLLVAIRSRGTIPPGSTISVTSSAAITRPAARDSRR